MNARQIALNAYYYGTLPLRWLNQRKLAQSGRYPIGVLFYHRVSDEHANDWTMSNAQFQRQMLWLKQNVDIVSLPEAQEKIRSGRNDRPMVAITFDDGYAENCDQTIPFLLDQHIPFTYFVALDFILNQKPFPHDAEQGIPLEINTPDQLREMAAAGVEIGAHTRTHCDVGAITDANTMIDEIVLAKNELSELVDAPIRYFAFPYGQVQNLSAAAARLSKDTGIKGVCSAFGSYNLPGEDAFHIQRFHGDPEFIRFKNWVTVDQRKMNVGRGFQIPESKLTDSALREFQNNQSAAVIPPTCGSSAGMNACSHQEL